MKEILMFILCLMVALLIGVSMWQVERKINYSFSYESMVQSEIKKMVKPECLK